MLEKYGDIFDAAQIDGRFDIARGCIVRDIFIGEALMQISAPHELQQRLGVNETDSDTLMASIEKLQAAASRQVRCCNVWCVSTIYSFAGAPAAWSSGA